MFKKLFPIFLLTITVLIVFFPVLTGGTFISTGLIYSDLMPFNYALKDWYRSLLLNNQLPFWTGLLGNGYPIFAEGQMGALYPFHLILFKIFPALFAFNLNLFIHYLGAAAFTFLFCRISLRLSTPASLLAAISYTFSGFMLTRLHQSNIVFVVSYLPLLFLIIERIAVTKKLFWFPVLSIVLAFQILSGHIEMFYYVSVASVLYFIFVMFIFPKGSSSNKKIHLTLLFILSFIIGAAIASPQLLATMELIKFSQRSEGLSMEASGGSVWPVESLWLFLNPKAFDIYLPTADFHPLNPNSVNYNVVYGYIGIIPFFLAFLGILTGIKKRNVLIFTFFLIAAFIFGLGQSTQVFAILWNIVPGLKFFREPVKILFLIEFSMAILAGLGLDYLLKTKKLSKQSIFVKLSYVLILATFLDIYFFSIRPVTPVTNATEWFTIPASAGFLQNKLKESSFRIHSCGTGNLDYSLSKNIKIQKDLQNVLPANFNLLYKIPSNQEWVVLFFKPMIDLNQQGLGFNSNGIVVPELAKRSLDLQNVKFITCTLPFQDADFILRKKIPLSQTINHYLFSANGQKQAIPTDSIYVYENKNFIPRAFLVSDVEIISDREKILKRVLSQDFNPRGKVILEEEIEGFESIVANSSSLRPSSAGEAISKTFQTVSNVEIIEDKETEITIKAKTEKPSILVLSDNYYPGWMAEVNPSASSLQQGSGQAGQVQEAKIYRANYTFKALILEKGENLIKLYFEPTYWKIGGIIAVIALTFNFLMLGYLLIKKK